MRVHLGLVLLALSTVAAAVLRIERALGQERRPESLDRIKGLGLIFPYRLFRVWGYGFRESNQRAWSDVW